MDISQIPPPQLKSLEFKDFSGGMTDFYIGGDANKYRVADNLLILKYGSIGKLFTRPGSEIYDATYYQIPPGAQRIGTLKYFQGTLFQQSSRKFYYINAGWTTLQGPSGNEVFPAGVDTTTVVSTATWGGHLFIANSDYSKVQKAYKDGGGTWQLRTAGLPLFATKPTVTAGAAGVAHGYLYRFIYFYTYSVGTAVFEDRGPAVEVFVTTNTTPDVNATQITGIPALANGAVDNYDTASASLKVEIYRTSDGGQNFYLAGTVTNGTASFADSMTDTTLVDGVPLYTEGGAPDNDPPPLAKVIHVVDGRGFYVNCKIGAQVFPNRVFQSVPDDIDSVPATFFKDAKDELVTCSSTRSIPILLGKNEVYRIDDGIDELGRGDLTLVNISVNAGCVSATSVVQTIDGIFWAGNDGFYFSDGYSVVNVSREIRETYQALIASDERKRRIVGKFDPNQRRIWWTTQRAADATDCDTCFVLDLNWGLSDSMPFTTISGGANFAPTALEFIGTDLIRGDTRGYAFQHDDELFVDPKVSVGTNPSTWQSATIIYDFVSIATDFGTSLYRKWVTSCDVVCKADTSLSLQITSINDDGRVASNLSPIRFRGPIVWGDPDILWGDPSLVWNYTGLVDAFRRFPAKSLRCEYKQIELTNALIAIVSSDILGTATVNNAAHTATLDDTVAYDWPSLAIDYYLAFAADGYVNTYLITARTDDVLTFSDTSGTAPSGSTKWVLRGMPKGEVLDLISFNLNYALIGMTQTPFTSAGSGEVDT